MSNGPQNEHFSPAENERLAALLDAAQWQRLTELIASPADHVEALRGDLDLQVAIARADVVPRLAGYFAPDESHGPSGWAHEPERSGPIGPASAAVSWSFAGEYVEAAEGEAPNASFQGVLGLGQRVELHGVTFMGVDDDGAFRLRRNVDWVGLYAQLGLSLNWRTPLAAARWRAERA